MGGADDSRSWDAEAGHYDEAADHGLLDPAVREAWRRLLLTHLPAPPATVADLGCGTGTLSLLLVQAGFTVHGVDFSPAMLGRARDKAGEAGAGLALSLGDAADPPLPARSFDVVLCRHVLWAVPDPGSALRRWCRLLRPAGRLLLVEGRWGTGAGLTAVQTDRLLRAAGRDPVVHPLDEVGLWGGPVDDERYLVLA